MYVCMYVCMHACMYVYLNKLGNAPASESYFSQTFNGELYRVSVGFVSCFDDIVI